MSAAFTYKQKMGISYCGDKTGFPRPGHIYKLLTIRLLYLCSEFRCHALRQQKDAAS